MITWLIDFVTKDSVARLIEGLLRIVIPTFAVVLLSQHTWHWVGPHGHVPTGRLPAEAAVSFAVVFGVGCGMYAVLRWPTFFLGPTSWT